MPRMAKSTRSWCFTLNNYTAEDEARIQALRPVYIVYGREEGDSGTPHLQGYMYFKDAKSLTGAKVFLGSTTVHVEAARAKPKVAADYCKKDGDIYEYGTCPAQGLRSDLAEALLDYKDGHSLEWMYLHHGTQAIKHVQGYHMARKAPHLERKVYWFHGDSGSGKTRAAYDLAGDNDVYITSGNAGSFFLDGYWAEKYVIFDDFRPTDLRLNQLLRYLDRYPVSINIKYGRAPYLAEHIIITSDRPPSGYYHGKDLAQVERRIHEIREFTLPDDPNPEGVLPTDLPPAGSCL